MGQQVLRVVRGAAARLVLMEVAAHTAVAGLALTVRASPELLAARALFALSGVLAVPSRPLIRETCDD